MGSVEESRLASAFANQRATRIPRHDGGDETWLLRAELIQLDGLAAGLADSLLHRAKVEERLCTAAPARELRQRIEPLLSHSDPRVANAAEELLSYLSIVQEVLEATSAFVLLTGTDKQQTSPRCRESFIPDGPRR